MKFVFAFPPTVNRMFPSGKNGRRYLSEQGKAYRKNLYGDSLEQHGVFKPLTGPLAATVELFPPDRRIRDIDNYNKALFDSMKHANIFIDDQQIKELHVYMREPGKGRCIVLIEAL